MLGLSQFGHEKNSNEIKPKLEPLVSAGEIGLIWGMILSWLTALGCWRPFLLKVAFSHPKLIVDVQNACFAEGLHV